MLVLPMPTVGGTPMFVAILGDRQSTLPANWTTETAIAIAAEAAFDAAAGAGPEASLNFVGITRLRPTHSYPPTASMASASTAYAVTPCH